MRAVLLAALSVVVSCAQVAAATFGTPVVIGGHAADLALDERRGLLYIANFAGRRIDRMSTADNTLRSPIPMTTHGESGSLALSPDNHYLVVTNYDNCGLCDFLQGSTIPTVTVIDLDAGSQKTCVVPPVPPPTTPPTPPAASACVALPPPPQPPGTVTNIPFTVAFGKGNQAFLVTTNTFFLFDPVALTFNPIPTQLLQPVDPVGLPLPLPFATFPPQIIQASAGVSGDGQTIFVLAQGALPQAATATTPAVPGNQVLFRYAVGATTVSADVVASTPATGPRVVSVNQDGSGVLAGWALLNQQDILMAEFPYPTGTLNLGGHAWDFSRNLIYAQVPAAGSSDPPTLHILDTDNLTVRERILLPQNLAGRSVFSSDMNTLYAISDDGVTVLPVGSLSTAHRVVAQEEQLLFQANGCTTGTIKQTLHIVDLGGGRVDFEFVAPAVGGVSASQVFGTTPANVTIAVDPNAFRSQTGTTVIPLTILSSGSVGIPTPVRLLINTAEPDQRGIIHSLPGKIVDFNADPFRGRIYALRQDRNEVIVMDDVNFNVLAELRTGNTPTKMTFTRDSRYMIVGNDHSQIANVFDLDALQPTPFIVFPRGHYPRDFAASNFAMFAVTRNSGSPDFGLAPPGCISDSGQQGFTLAFSGVVDQIDFGHRNAKPPCSLGIYINNVPIDSVMTISPSGGSIFVPMSDGTVLLFDDTYQAFEASRKDLAGLSGSYSAVSDDLFFAGGILFDRSMLPTGSLNTATPTSSVLISGTNALTVNATAPAAPGLANQVSLLSPAARPTRTAEAPVTKAILTTPQIGQIGQTIPTFLQTMATTSAGSVLYLSVSGFTELPPGFDQPAPMPLVVSVGNSANGGLIAPGSLITISGSGLSSASASAPGMPLPTALADVCATVNHVALPLFQVSPGQINAQLPYEVSGAANLVITGPGGASAPFSFTALPAALAVLAQAGDPARPMIYRASNGATVDSTNPIHPDDTLQILATGLGQTSPGAVSGAAAPSDPLESSLTVPSVALDGTSLQVTFAGLVPGLVGVYQINAVVPHDIQAGAQLPLVVQQGAAPATFMVSVTNP